MYKSFAATQGYAGKPGGAYPQDGQYTQSPQYNQRKHTLTVKVSPPKGGTISRNPSKKAYDDGEMVRVTVKADSNYLFTGWSGAAIGLPKRLTLTMDGDKTLTAHFYRKGSTQRIEVPETHIIREIEAGDTVSVSKDFVGYDVKGKPVYLIKTKIKEGSGEESYRIEKDYRADGDTASKYLFVGRDNDDARIYRGFTKQEIQNLQEVLQQQDFSAGRRFGTWALNMVSFPGFPTGLGSFSLMKDYVGGSIMLGTSAVATVALLAGRGDDNGGLILSAVVLIIGNNLFNIARSATYHTPMHRVSATAADFKPYDGLKFAVVPTESGDFKVFARYDYSF